MITAVIRGGLGNQLFQYASAYALAKRLGQPLMLDISFFPKQTLRGYKLDKLNLAPHRAGFGEEDGCLLKAYKNRNINGLIRRSPFQTLPIKDGRYLIDHSKSYTPLFHTISENNVFLNGYFQSDEYFRQLRPDLLNQITPNYKHEKSYQMVQDEINAVTSVAVHVRRGDFAAGQGAEYHYTLNSDYYREAMEIIVQRVKSPEFFFFSDDMDWVRSNFEKGERVRYISLKTQYADVDELMLMKSCNHIITANSTFSWWAAWLNEHEDAIRIVPAKAYGINRMIPDTWIKI